MKRFVAIVLSIIMIIMTVVSSYAVKIDGIDDGVEWQALDADVEINNKNVNNVSYAYIKHRIINEHEFCVFLFLSDYSSSDMDNAGFVINFFDDITVTVTAEGTQVTGDENKYYVDSEIVFDDDNNAVSCEILFGFKRGIPDKINGTVSFIDGQGINSYFYPFIISLPVEQTTVVKTTAPKTSVQKTTKPEKTTKSKPTEKKTTTTKAVKTTAEKTTKKQTEKKQEKTYVYFYEKEVVISQVIVTEPVNSTILTEEGDGIESQTEIVTQKVDITTGFVVQRVVVSAGIILLIVGGAVAGMSIKKSKRNDTASEENKSDNE